MRKPVTMDEVDVVLMKLREQIGERLRQKGNLSYASIHEILGIIDEEKLELILAVKSNDVQEVVNELFDIAVGCMFGVACIENVKIDW